MIGGEANKAAIALFVAPRGEVRRLKLRDLLATGKWLEADRETAVLMLRVCSREKEGWLRPTKDIDNFPCQDLRTIDQLWVKYSYGRFGLSVQEDIWQRIGATKFSKEAGLAYLVCLNITKYSSFPSIK